MKKMLTLIMTVMLLGLLALPVGAESRYALDAEERDLLDTFFSNFAEAHVGSFVMNNEIPMDTLIDFGVRHNIINRKYDLVKVNDGYWGVKKEAVEDAVYKYFGISVDAVSSRRYGLTNGVYLVPKAYGEAFTFAQIEEWNSNGNGVWTGIVSIYSASSGFTGNVHGTFSEWNRDMPHDVPSVVDRYSFTVTRSPADPDRYVLVDWLQL